MYDLSMCKAATLTPILLHAQYTHTILMCQSAPRTVRIPHLIQHSCDTFHQAIFSGSPSLLAATPHQAPATPTCFCCGWYSAPAHTPLTQLRRRECRPFRIARKWQSEQLNQRWVLGEWQISAPENELANSSMDQGDHVHVT